MGYVVKVSNGSGGSGWISKLNAEGIRSVGDLRRAQVFPTRDGAQHEIERLSNHLPDGAIRIRIEQQ
ncbi:MAG TPA: hypothetical protein VGP63_20765 [Planctomycetaceae bacterium]|jgi:hypothetical protein|nr:hypothetical protein [Planctomycetaceae bacterium]